MVEQLDNGAVLVTNHVDGTPATTLRIGTAHGSLQDPDGRSGAAHLFEHMMFETSPVRTADEVRGLRRELGGHSNGITNHERVWVEATVPTADADRALGLLGDMYARPGTDAALLERQRSIVHRELQHSYADADRHVAMQGRRLLYGGESVWARWPLGSRSTIDRIGSDDHARWLDDAVTGANTVALVDGDLRRVDVDALRTTLAALPSGHRAPNPRFEGIVAGGAWSAIAHSGRATTAIDLTLPVMPGNPDAGLDVVREVVTERMRTRLREQDGLLYGIEGGHGMGPRGSGISLRMLLDPRDVRAGSRAIAQELHALADGIPAAELDQARAWSAARAAMRTPDTSSQQAMAAFNRLVNADAVGDDVARVAGLGTRREAAPVDPPHVQATATAVLDPAHARYVLHGAVRGRAGDFLAGLEDAGVATGSLRHVPFPRAWTRMELEQTSR